MAVCVLSPAGLSQNFEEARQAPAPRPMSPILRGPLASAAVGAGMCVCLCLCLCSSVQVPCVILLCPHIPKLFVCLFVCVQGNYSDLLVSLSGIYSKLRGDTTGEKNEDAAQVCAD